MSLVHQKLYEADTLTQINLKSYIVELVDYLASNYEIPDNAKVEYDCDDGFSVGIDTALPCGLILNELIINAIRHAFRNNPDPMIGIRIDCPGDNTIRIRVSDNGPGLPAEFDMNESKGIGLQNAVNIAKYQLKGTVEMNNDDGFSFTLTFPPDIYEDRL